MTYKCIHTYTYIHKYIHAKCIVLENAKKDVPDVSVQLSSNATCLKDILKVELYGIKQYHFIRDF